MTLQCSWFLSRFFILVEWEFTDFVCVGGVGWRKTREKPLKRGENQQRTQPTYGTELASNLGHIGQR